MRSKTIAFLNKGDMLETVEVVERSDGSKWYKVDTYNIVGYVSAKYTRRVD